METPEIAVTLTTPESAGKSETPLSTPDESITAPKSSSSETLSTPESASSSETLTPPSPAPPKSFVPPLVDRTEDEDFFRLYAMHQRWGLSIESAELKFIDGRDRERSVYGTIYMNTQYYRVHPLYKRSSGEAEAVPGGGGHLSLSGPKYFVDITSPSALFVELYEVGSASHLISKRVSLWLPLSRIAPSRRVTVRVKGEEVTLAIRITAICPSIPTKISLELSYPDSYNEWLVSGSVTAIQVLRRGKTKRRVCLFNRRADDPIRALEEDGHVSPGRHRASISPHRNVFVSPLWFEKSYIEKVDKVLEDCGEASTGMVSDNDRYNGVGSYLSVEVDLTFVNSVDAGKTCLVQGALHYQFKCTHEHMAIFKESLKGPVLMEKKDPKLPRLNPDIDHDEIQVTLTLMPYIELYPDMDEEPYEKDMPLYVECITVVSDDTNSSCSEDEEMLSNKPIAHHNDDERKESKDEEMLPSTDQVDEESNKPIADQVDEEMLPSTDQVDEESNTDQK